MDKYLQLVIGEAKSAQASGDYPYGAVLVRGDEVIGIGRNHMNTNNDPTVMPRSRSSVRRDYRRIM